MKTAFRRKTENGAVVLTATICTFFLMSFLVVGYLWMTMEQSKAAVRSEHWNAALTVAEAGIDEGMAHIDYGFGTNVNLEIDGWTSNATENYFGPMIRSLSNDVGSSYSVIISNTVPPIVTSIATISDNMNPVPIKRAVQVTMTPNFAFPRGLTLNTNGVLEGNNITIHSDIASVNGSISVQNGDVYGNVLTGPNGQTTVGANGSITGGTNNNFYANLPSVQPPYSFGLTPPQPTRNGVATISSPGSYFLNNANGLPYNPGQLQINAANVVLYVTGSFQASSISIQPNASLTLYVGSTNTSSSTSATFGQTSSDTINASGSPEQFLYYGLANNTTITLKNGLTVFNGLIYAPEADLSEKGNISIFGAMVLQSFTGNGNTTFTYDPNADKSVVVGYSVASWKEIPPP